MKRIILSIAVVFFAAALTAQNVGINTNTPQATLDVNGTLKVGSLTGATDQMVVSDANGNISVMPLPTPDQIVNLTGSGATTISGTYPNFTISSTDNVNDADSDPANEIQTLSLTGSTLDISSGNSVDLSSLAGPAGVLEDADADTKIQVEETVDDDVIRFDLEGVERFVFSTNAGGNSLISFPNTNGNVVLGENAGTPLTTGISNTIIGTEAGSAITTGFLNTFIGRRSGQSTVGSGDNTFIGSFAGTDNVSGGENVFLGSFTGTQNVSGSFNTFLGRFAGTAHTSGNNNTFVGYGAGLNNLTGSGNVFLGQNAGENEAGNNKLYINNSGSASPLIYGEFDNDILAVHGKLQLAQSTAGEMVIINGDAWSHSAGSQDFGDGGDHFIMASEEGSGESAGVHGDGDNLTFWSAGDAATGQSAALAYFLDEDLFDAADSDPFNNNALKAYLNTAGIWQVSDQNKKQNIQPMDHALEKVLQLGGYTYEFAPNEKERAKGDKPLPAAGIMAQDLKQVLPQAVNENAQGDYFVNYSAIVPLLIEAIKDQQKAMEDQQAEIDVLKGQIQVLQNQ